MKYKIEYENKIKKYLKENNKKYRYYTETFGCALNENDTLKYEGMLKKSGMKKIFKKEKADVIILNTCCIRQNAEKTLLGKLGEIKRLKQAKKELVVCVVGCMIEEQDVVQQINKSYSFVDILIGTRNLKTFAKKLYQKIAKLQKSSFIEETEFDIEEGLPIIQNDKYRASVAIIYGCNNFCSYCIVPYVRGRERSRKKRDILNDIKNLAKKGYKEITLLGQNVNSYGNDFKDEKCTFVDLLKDIEKINEIEIIKFISPHPKDFSDELIDFLSKSKKVSKQIHLPLQSGSAKILSLMNRKYSKEEYLNLVNKIKQKVEGVTLSTDVIVGFPQETEKDFKETLDVVQKVGFSQIYMFCYSVRKGTTAEKMEGQIKEEIKVKRLQKVKKTFEKMLFNENEKLIGKEEDVLVEGKSKNNNKMYTGRTIDGKIIVFNANKEDVGKIIKVKVTKNNLWFLTGEK